MPLLNMRKFELVITKELDGQSVGNILRYRFFVSSRLLPELKRTGGIILNGKSVTVREKVKEGDVFTLCLCEETPSENVVAVDIPLCILYEDEDILAVSKPKDMPVHPSLHNYENTLGNAVMYYYRDREFVFRPITRLDRDTTGIVLIAKNRLSAALLSDSMKNGQIKKTYLAYLSKTPKDKKGEIEAPIERCDESVIKRKVSPDGKYALTKYEIVSEKPDGTCVARINPITGRTHQIRVHMAHIGCPLVYDYLYGTEIPEKTLFLHCETLDFVHPITREEMHITCPVSPDSELYSALF